ncbi:MAG: EsaB/YukD family protein [Candidatus Paralactobacillus gallistercoris]|uniref:EsaB/YukD family protein n=1 Tax=Candidatus Paralactobacillus gallistercoris TaxID=2838724 RepID=A0A948X3H2_9LACO|nr:EsaB/YukD family protein [Candidatus Paralactobacillus gallistercoris]
MNNTVTITLRWRNQLNVDLQIPLDMQLTQLLAELIDIYDLPDQPYALYFVTKQQVTGPRDLFTNKNKTLRQCQISDGDILRLMEAADDNYNDLSI